jgi:hypothetical protein
MSEHNDTKGVWGLLGKLLLMASVLIALVQVVTWLKSWGNELKATMHGDAFYVPEGYEEALRSNYEAGLTPVALAPILSSMRLGSNDINTLSSYLNARTVSARLSELTNVLLLKRVEGVQIMEVQNTGAVPFSNVSLKLPGVVMARIQYEGGAVSNLANLAGIAPIGTINSKEHVRLTTWTTTSSEMIKEADIILRHSSGIGSISFQTPVGAPWRTMDFYWAFSPFVCIMLFLILALYVTLVLCFGKCFFTSSKCTQATGPSEKSFHRETS